MGVTLLERPTALGQIPQQPAPTDRDDDLVDPLVYEPNPEALDTTPVPSIERTTKEPEDNNPRDPRTRRNFVQYRDEHLKSKSSFVSNNQRRRGHRPVLSLKRGDTGKKHRIALDHCNKVDHREERTALEEQLACVSVPILRCPATPRYANDTTVVFLGDDNYRVVSYCTGVHSMCNTLAAAFIQAAQKAYARRKDYRDDNNGRTGAAIISSLDELMDMGGFSLCG